MARLAPGVEAPVEARRTETVAVVGVMPNLQAGDVVDASGRWRRHSRHGREFTVPAGAYSILAQRPDAVDEARLALEYLGSRLIADVGRRTAQRIVGAFGAETPAVIMFSPERLTPVGGIGMKTARRIAEMWRAHDALRAAMAAARRNGDSSRLVVAVYQRDGEDGLRRLTAEPATTAAEAHSAL